MAKVYHFTLMLELKDDAPHPEDWDWIEMLEPQQRLGLQGFNIIDIEQRPYACMEEDPTSHTQH